MEFQMQKQRKSSQATPEVSRKQEVAAKQGTALAIDSLNPWIEIASELDKFVGAPFLKFTKTGEFAISDTDLVPNGTRCIGHIDQAEFGWRKWQGGKPIDPRMGRVADGFVPPQRHELGDTDERRWETDDQGQRRDPWQFCASVPLTRLTGESYLFSVSSKGGLRAVNSLIRAYGTRIAQKGKDAGLPVVELQPGFYKHRTYGKIFFPDLKVVNWLDENGKPLSLKGEMEDEVPDLFNGGAA
jgi:hypothetical protein